MPRLILILLLISSWTVSVYCQTVVLTDNQEKYPIGRYTETLEDPQHSFTLEQVRGMKFEKSTRSIINKGFSNSTYWLHFRLRHQAAGEALPFILELDFPSSFVVDLYAIDKSGKIQKEHIALYETYKTLPIHTTSFRLPLALGEEKEFYLRLHSDKGQQYFPPIVWKEQPFLQYISNSTWYFGIYYGMMILVILYHIVLFFLTRERLYIFLLLYLCCWFTYEGFRGYGLFLRLFQDIHFFNTFVFLLSFQLGCATFLIFYNKVLHFSQRPFMRLLVAALLILQLVGIVVSTVVSFTDFRISLNLLVSITGIPLGIIVMLMSLWVWVKGMKTARFYALASVSVTFGTVLMMVQRSGLIESEHPLIMYGSNFGSILEFIFLTFGVADTHRFIRDEKRNVERETREQQLRQAIELEKATLEGQKQERQRIADELHDNLGNVLTGLKLQLSQLIQSANAQINPQIEKVYKVAQEAAVQVRLISHNLLPEQLESKGLSASITQMVTDFDQHSSVNFGIHVADQLDESLNAITSFEVYTICLELVNNVITHAKAQEATLRVLTDSKDVWISMTDDGIGFELPQDTEGRGLRRIQERIAAFDGTVEIEQLEEGGSKVSVYLKNIVDFEGQN